MVGGNNSINPITGQPEFFWQQLIGSAIVSGIGSLLAGNSGKQSLKNALIGGVTGGIGSAIMPGLFGAGAGAGAGAATGGNSISEAARNMIGSNGGFSADAMAKAAASSNPFVSNPNTLGTASIASKLFGKNGVPEGGLGRTLLDILNTPAGEALAFGLGSQLLSKGKDKEEDRKDQTPFGGTTAWSPILGGYAAGGEAMPMEAFQRRNGGIMPYEGSGTEDDVPAMLMAGEFVLNKPAIEGLGDGDSNLGIQRAYALQNNLEGKARNG